MTTRTALSLLALSLSLAACGAEGIDPLETDDADAYYTADAEKTDRVRPGRFETFTGRDGKAYFHLLAGNGEKVLASQGYASARGAEQGIDSVRRHGAEAAAYQLLEARDGQWYFNLRARNGELLAASELYVSRANAERGLATVMAVLATATQHQLEPRDPRFQVFRGLDGQYYFHLRADNGEIVLVSEGFRRRGSAIDGTGSVRAHGASLSRYEVREARDGQHYFVLRAVNGRVIGLSETYPTRAGAERAVADVVALLQQPVHDAQ